MYCRYMYKLIDRLIGRWLFPHVVSQELRSLSSTSSDLPTPPPKPQKAGYVFQWTRRQQKYLVSSNSSPTLALCKVAALAEGSGLNSFHLVVFFLYWLALWLALRIGFGSLQTPPKTDKLQARYLWFLNRGSWAHTHTRTRTFTPQECCWGNLWVLLGKRSF